MNDTGTTTVLEPESLLDSGEPAAEAMVGGYQLAMPVGAALVLVAVAIAVVAFRARVDESPAAGGDVVRVRDGAET